MAQQKKPKTIAEIVKDGGLSPYPTIYGGHTYYHVIGDIPDQIADGKRGVWKMPIAGGTQPVDVVAAS